MPLRVLAATAIAGVSAAAAAAASCRGSGPCDAANSGDAPSLLQAAPHLPGKHPRHRSHELPGSEDQDGGRAGFLPDAGDDEDKDAELIGVARNFEPPLGSDAPEGAEVFGEVWMTASKGRSDSTRSQRLFWNLLDVDPGCHKGNGDEEGTVRSCKIMLFDNDHNPCSSNSDPEVLYNRKARKVDPWRYVTYTSVKGEDTARSKFSRRVETGLSAADLRAAMAEGLWIAVYGFSERSRPPMACARIVSAKSRPAASMQRMAPLQRGAARDNQAALVQQACSGSGACQAVRAWHFEKMLGATTNVWGRVLIYEIMGETNALMGHYMTWDFEEMDPFCTSGPTAAGTSSRGRKSCGIRITGAKSCKEAEENEQSDFWNPSNVLSNPWGIASYTTIETASVTIAQGLGTAVLTGHDSPDIIGRALVVYDAKGIASACAVLEIAN